MSKKNLPELETYLAKVLSDEQNGRNGLEAILISLRNQAIKGDVKAAQLLLERAYQKVSVKDEKPNEKPADWLSKNPLRAVNE